MRHDSYSLATHFDNLPITQTESCYIYIFIIQEVCDDCPILEYKRYRQQHEVLTTRTTLCLK